MRKSLVAALFAISYDHNSDTHSTSSGEASKSSVKEKCESCTSFDIYAPHLNDHRQCTCDGEDCTPAAPCAICQPLITKGVADCADCREHVTDCFNCVRLQLLHSQTFHRATVMAARVVVAPDVLSPASKDCTGAAPCGICKRLMILGKADCKKCRQRDYDYEHAKGCFNCLRRYFVFKEQPFHNSIVTAARIVGLPTTPSGWADVLVYPMPNDVEADRCSEDGMLMWELIEAGQVILGCPSALTPTDTSCDPETDDDEASEASDDSSATRSSRSVSPEAESMDVVPQQVEGTNHQSPLPTSLEPESVKVGAQQIEDVTGPTSPQPTSPEPESMDIEAQQIGEVVQPPSPRLASPEPEPEPMEIVAQPVEEVTHSTSLRSEHEAVEDVIQQTEEGAQGPSSRPVSPEPLPEPMTIVMQQVEGDESPPSPPATRSNKRKRRLSQVLSPTPEPHSSASPDPVPRTVLRHTHLPAFTYQPTRSPSPIIPIRPDINVPQQSLTYGSPPAATSTALTQAIQPPTAIQSAPLADGELSAVRKRREHRAWMDVYEKKSFNLHRETRRSQRDRLLRQLSDLEKEDQDARTKEIQRLQAEIERLERNE